MSTHRAHHLHITPDDAAGNQGLGRYFLVPGSPARAKLIAEMFDSVSKEILPPRRNDTYLGTVRAEDGRTIDVGVTSSGMGVGSIEISAYELIESGVRRMIRVGTSGAVYDESVKIGSYVIATGAVRDETASNDYLPPSVPAVAHPDTVTALVAAADRLGFADRTFRGVIHSKASLYGRARMQGPMKEMHTAFKEALRGGKVLSSEMEASVLFIMAQALSETALSVTHEHKPDPRVIKAGAVMGIIGSEEGWGDDAALKQIEIDSCRLAIQGIREMFRLEHSS